MNTLGAQRRQALGKYLTLLVGASILAFGLYNVHRQSGITEGGVLGMTLLLNHWFGISPAISGFIMDITCYIIGFKYLGKQFAKYAVVASACFALCYAFFERFDPVLPNFADLPLVASLVGGLVVGIGVGLVVSVGGASGGDDALALVISHVTKCKIARAYLATDLVVLVLSVSYIPLAKLLFSLVTVTLSSFIIGFVQKISMQRHQAVKG